MYFISAIASIAVNAVEPRGRTVLLCQIFVTLSYFMKMSAFKEMDSIMSEMSPILPDKVLERPSSVPERVLNSLVRVSYSFW